MNDDHPHVCFVAPNFYPVFAGRRDIPIVGGAEFRQSVLARALARSGYRVTVITQDFGQPDGEIVDGIRVLKTHGPMAGIPGLRYVHPRLTFFVRRIREVRADFYYQSCASHLTAVIAWHCRGQGGRSIYGGASDTDFMRGQERMKYARDRWLFRWGLANVDAIVVQSARQAELVRRQYDREAIVIPNPYEPPRRLKTQRDDLVLWVGGIRRVKRPECFITLARALPRFRFRMIGGPSGDDASAQAYYEAIRAEAITVPNLEFLGFLPVADVESHFDEARVFVNTSEHEGFPNTFLQAWARGIPTVSFFDAGGREDGSRPFLWVTSGDDAANAVSSLLSDSRKWQALSGECQSHFSAFNSVEKVVKAYHGLFNSLGG